MPYTWIEAPLFLEHEGVKVYRIFKSDDADEANVRPFLFGLTPHCSEDGDENGEFDVRELDTWNRFTDEGDASVVRAITEAIDSGELLPFGVESEPEWPKWPKTVHMYVHGDTEQTWEIGEKLGLAGEALSLFGHALDEYKLTFSVQENGAVDVIAVDDRQVALKSTAG